MERMFNVAIDMKSDRFVSERKRKVEQMRLAKMNDKYKKSAGVDMSEENDLIIETFEADNACEIEKDAKKFLREYYTDKNFTRLKKRLEMIRYKEFEGYGHLSDLEVCLLPETYFKRQMYLEYANVSSLIMFEYATKKEIAKKYNVSPNTLFEMCQIDYVLNAYIEEGTALNVREIEKSLVYKAIVERDIQAIKFALTNVFKDKWKDMRHAEATVTTKSALDEELGEMSVEELERLLAEAEDAE